MFETMTWLQANHDDLRLRMLREPRGYPAANCNLILPSAHPEADAGFVIMEQVEYPRDVGHQHDVRRDGAARDRDAPDDRSR